MCVCFCIFINPLSGHAWALPPPVCVDQAPGAHTSETWGPERRRGASVDSRRGASPEERRGALDSICSGTGTHGPDSHSFGAEVSSTTPGGGGYERAK